MSSTGVDHRILGTSGQYVELLLPPDEAVSVDSRALLFVDDGITIEERAHSLSLATAANHTDSQQRLAAGWSTTGTIVVLPLTTAGSKLLCRDDAVLAMFGEVAIHDHSDRFLQFSGSGTLVVFAIGASRQHQLAGNQVRVEPSTVVAIEKTIDLTERPADQPLAMTLGGHGRVWTQMTTTERGRTTAQLSETVRKPSR